MFAVSRRYRFDAAEARAIHREIEEYFLPMIRSRPGFVAYYWFDAGDGVGESVSVFETEAEVRDSIAFAARWVKLHELERLLGTPTILLGEVAAHHHGAG